MLYRVYTAVHKIRKRKERRDPNDGCQKSQEETDGGQLSVVSGANAGPLLYNCEECTIRTRIVSTSLYAAIVPHEAENLV